ncbi:hypothetical protein CHY_0645 [Carboxydothermus hydrogenoformans Z-2901]|uniref:Uncharacterized protein n=1 Tax=Carboxydothermus hydrogenoformans (strain ATCC BAA-161 / DSM 6008 / Z-2901) TaxID=246194 RepID=Q3AED3_CARHZ|nr:hypothetical protein CHY_0645 [Carboxydothermus hydrogenoformans Z-2901]
MVNISFIFVLNVIYIDKLDLLQQKFRKCYFSLIIKLLQIFLLFSQY